VTDLHPGDLCEARTPDPSRSSLGFYTVFCYDLVDGAIVLLTRRDSVGISGVAGPVWWVLKPSGQVGRIAEIALRRIQAAEVVDAR